MKLKAILVAAALAMMSTSPGSAATYNLGDVTFGAAASKTLPGARKVDYFTLSIGNAPAGSYISQLDIDTLGSVFDTEIGLYTAGGKLVASNRNGGPGYGSQSRLLFSGGDVPSAGLYTLVLGAWNINFTDDIALIQINGYPSGTYNLNIATQISLVPLPAGGVLLLTALAGIAGLARWKKRAS